MVVSAIKGRAAPVYYYIPLCLLGWLPWWPLGLVALIRQRSGAGWESGRRLLSPGLCLVVTGFCVFSFVGSKHATYLLPFAPWAALEISRLLGRDPLLRRPAVVLPVAGLAAAVYLVAVTQVPSRESRMGMHSSLRGVAEALHREHAVGIYSDHFWPSLEVYYGENIHFSSPAPEEVYEKSDEPLAHFGFHDHALAGKWFVHFRKSNDTDFLRWMNDPGIPKTVVGDFVIGPLTPPVAALPSGSQKPMMAAAHAHALPPAPGRTLR